jgi:hypothetical protein
MAGCHVRNGITWRSPYPVFGSLRSVALVHYDSWGQVDMAPPDSSGLRDSGARWLVPAHTGPRTHARRRAAVIANRQGAAEPGLARKRSGVAIHLSHVER